MFNLEKIKNKKEELDYGFDFQKNTENSTTKKEKKVNKIKEELTLLKRDKAQFTLLKDSIETFFYINGSELFDYTIYDNRIEVKFYYIDNNLNKEKVEKVKNFLNKYQKEKVFTNLKVISL